MIAPALLLADPFQPVRFRALTNPRPTAVVRVSGLCRLTSDDKSCLEWSGPKK